METKLYVKLEDVPKTKFRKDFIKKFLKGKVINSYSDADCNILQCEGGRFRSITELHQMCQARFPKTSFEAIVRIVKELIDEDACVSMVWCTQINKVVLKYFDRATKSYMTKMSRENYYNSKGVDGYSLSDYEQIIDKLNK